MVFSSVYGPPFVREGGVRRDAYDGRLRELRPPLALFPELDSPGGTICEPNDAPTRAAPADQPAAPRAADRDGPGQPRRTAARLATRRAGRPARAAAGDGLHVNPTELRPARADGHPRDGVGRVRPRRRRGRPHRHRDARRRADRPGHPGQERHGDRHRRPASRVSPGAPTSCPVSSASGTCRRPATCASRSARPGTASTTCSASSPPRSGSPTRRPCSGSRSPWTTSPTTEVIVGSPPPDFQSLGMGTVGQSLLAQTDPRAVGAAPARRDGHRRRLGTAGRGVDRAARRRPGRRRPGAQPRPRHGRADPGRARSTRTSRGSTRPGSSRASGDPRRLGHACSRPTRGSSSRSLSVSTTSSAASCSGARSRPTSAAPRSAGSGTAAAATTSTRSTPGRRAAASASTARGDPDGQIALLVRGELLRRYPNASLYAWRSVSGVLAANPRVPEDLRTPVFAGVLGADITFVGFDLGAAELLSGDGWFFVIQEQADRAAVRVRRAGRARPAARPRLLVGRRPGSTPEPPPARYLRIAGNPLAGTEPRRRAVRRPRRPPGRAHPPAADAGRHPRRRRSRSWWSREPDPGRLRGPRRRLWPATSRSRCCRSGSRRGSSTDELRVRIFPDQIHLDSHEPELTAYERTAGEAYWRARFATPDPDARPTSPWADLCGGVEPSRAVWVVEALTPLNLDQLDGSVAPEFPATPARDAEWSVAARAVALPRRWLVVGRRDGAEVLRAWTAEVADRLDVSPAPDLDGPRRRRRRRAAGHGPLDGRLRRGRALPGWPCGSPRPRSSGGLDRGVDQLLVARCRLGPHPGRRRRERPAAARPPRLHRRAVGDHAGHARPTSRSPAGPAAPRPTSDSSRRWTPSAVRRPTPSPAPRPTGSTAPSGCRSLRTTCCPRYPERTAGAQETEVRLADALWESTLGSFLSDVLRPVVPDSRTGAPGPRARAPVPGRAVRRAARSSRQPYGVLPVVAGGFEPDPAEPVEAGLLGVLDEAAALLGAGRPEGPPPRPNPRPRRRPRRAAPDHAARGGGPVPHRPRAAHGQLDGRAGPARGGAAVHQQHARGPPRRCRRRRRGTSSPSTPATSTSTVRSSPTPLPGRLAEIAELAPDQRQLRAAQGPGGRGRHAPRGAGALRRRARAASRGSGTPSTVSGSRRASSTRCRSSACCPGTSTSGSRPSARYRAGSVRVTTPSEASRVVIPGVTGPADGTRVRHRPPGRRPIRRRTLATASGGCSTALDGPELLPARRARPGAARPARRVQPPARRLVHLAGDPAAGRRARHDARRACTSAATAGSTTCARHRRRASTTGSSTRRRCRRRRPPPCCAAATWPTTTPSTRRWRSTSPRTGSGPRSPCSTASRRASRWRRCSATGSSARCATAA